MRNVKRMVANYYEVHKSQLKRSHPIISAFQLRLLLLLNAWRSREGAWGHVPLQKKRQDKKVKEGERGGDIRYDPSPALTNTLDNVHFIHRVRVVNRIPLLTP